MNAFACIGPYAMLILSGVKPDAETVRELNATDPVSDPVDARVVSLIEALADEPYVFDV